MAIDLAFLGSGSLAAFAQVVMIDLVLASDNAVAVGLVASGVDPRQRRKVIVIGLAMAVVCLISLALVATKLLHVIGLLLAGGVLLLWVSWKMWRDLSSSGQAQEELGEAVLEGEPTPAPAQPKSIATALMQVLIADLTMSLDNVLAVAGAAREHPTVLIAGLLLSITLMGVAASWLAELLHKHRWVGYIGLAMVAYVAVHMVWEGHRDLIVDLGKTDAYNAALSFAPISPEEAAKYAR